MAQNEAIRGVILMKIEALKIKNYKSIKELTISQLENACILVGRNNTGKTVILDAIMTAFGQKEVVPKNFNELGENVEITVRMSINSEDLEHYRTRGNVSRYRKDTLFLQDFCNKFPSYKDGCITFTFVANKDGSVRYGDGVKKHNPWIERILPKIYYIDHRRDIAEIEADILQTGVREKTIGILKDNHCMFDARKDCIGCFKCVGKLEKKSVSELTIFETEKLLEYKLLHADTSDFMDRLNQCFKKNTGMKDTLVNHLNVDPGSCFDMSVVKYRDDSDIYESIEDMSEGMKSIYIMSLLEAYMEEKQKLPCILMIEDPELYLHPQLQKTASEILYKLSIKNQIIFSTHSPTMIFNFNNKQIKQVALDKDGYPMVYESNELSKILDDLGYSADDLMNVSFVFIVEGKQDKSRLPLLLKKYYSDISDKDGRLQRISIIATNSCTNIKTYANLKYINQFYLKDHFLMIRDGDGKDADYLKAKLCNYYADRSKEDVGALPRVKPDNVLVLKYYSFENYFFNPEIMAKIGVIKSPDEFYEILFSKYKEYLYKNKSFIKIKEIMEREFTSAKDMQENMELIKIYGRGHNLYDIFYGRFKGAKENEVLGKYIDIADRKEFEDILDAIDRFVYFDNRRIE